jgi:hypothetical protein
MPRLQDFREAELDGRPNLDGGHRGPPGHEEYKACEPRFRITLALAALLALGPAVGATAAGPGELHLPPGLQRAAAAGGGQAQARCASLWGAVKPAGCCACRVDQRGANLCRPRGVQTHLGDTLRRPCTLRPPPPPPWALRCRPPLLPQASPSRCPRSGRPSPRGRASWMATPGRRRGPGAGNSAGPRMPDVPTTLYVCVSPSSGAHGAPAHHPVALALGSPMAPGGSMLLALGRAFKLKAGIEGRQPTQRQSGAHLFGFRLWN